VIPWGSAIEELRLKASHPVCDQHPVAPSGSSDAPRKLCSARKRSVSNKCFNCAKAERQQQSAQSERKSTTRYSGEPY